MLTADRFGGIPTAYTKPGTLNQPLWRLVGNDYMQGARYIRNEAYFLVRRSDECERNAADGRFPTAYNKLEIFRPSTAHTLQYSAEWSFQ